MKLPGNGRVRTEDLPFLENFQECAGEHHRPSFSGIFQEWEGEDRGPFSSGDLAGEYRGPSFSGFLPGLPYGIPQVCHKGILMEFKGSPKSILREC